MARGAKKVAKTEDQKKAERDRQIANRSLRKPEKAEKRKELFVQLKSLEREAKDASFEKSAHVKSMVETYGFHKHSVPIIKRMMELSPIERAYIFSDIVQARKDYGWDEEDAMFRALTNSGTEDQGSILDKTTAGEKLNATRADDPARAQKAQTPDAPTPAPSEPIPLDEARKKFEAANRAAAAKGKGAVKAAEPAPAKEEKPAPAAKNKAKPAKAEPDSVDKFSQELRKANAKGDEMTKPKPGKAPASDLDEDEDDEINAPPAIGDDERSGSYAITH